MTPDHVEQLLQKLWDMGMKGDVAAAKLVLSYTVGKPFEGIDLEILDLEASRLADELSDEIRQRDDRAVETALREAGDQFRVARSQGA